MAEITDLQNFKLTKDGELPTQSDDQALIEVMQLEDRRGSLTAREGVNFVSNELGQLVEGGHGSIRRDPLENGTFVYGSATSGGESAFVALLITDAPPAILIRCSGKDRSNPAEFEEFVRKKFIRTGIRAR